MAKQRRTTKAKAKTRAKAPAKKDPRVARAKVAELEDNPDNPRWIREENLAGLRESIREFGLVELVVFNERTGRVVSGHQRVSLLREAGVEETDVVIVNLSPAKEKALATVLNSRHVAGEFTDGLRDIEAEDRALFEALRLGELAGPAPDELAPVQVRALELGPVADRFWISVRGPLAKQADALEVLREQLADIDGVEVELGVTAK